MDFEYVDSTEFHSPKLRLVRDKDGRLFVRKNTRIDTELAEKLRGISSPYIVKIIEFGEDSDGAYVLEEYVEGVSAAGQALTQKQAVKALIQLCGALEALHSAKIIHRDIKPSNIIITLDGNIKLIDFDASRVEKTVQDKDTQILGTEGFAPPEQFGFSQTDSRSDIYSFGVTMKLLLGGNSVPFGKIIKKCKALDPDNRYQSISQVKTAIRLAAFKGIAAIPAAAVLLVGFIMTFSTVLKNKNPVDFTNELPSESYESSSSSSTVSSSDPLTTQLFSPVPQPEDNGDIGNDTDASADTSEPDSSRQLSDIPDDSDNTHQPENTSQPSSELPDNSRGSQQTENSEPTEGTPGTPDTQSSEPSEPSNGSQNTESSQPPEVTQPSETDGKFFTTIINEHGYHEDVCDYIFIDDNSVHGAWEVIGTVKKDRLKYFTYGVTDLMEDNNIDVAWLQNVEINPDGSAVVNGDWKMKWTSGYIIPEFTYGQYVDELYTVNINGKDYLMLENKSGDYAKSGLVTDYFVLIRQEPQQETKQEPPKITFTTTVNSKGYYEDVCDYYFYDDPSVHGTWDIAGVINKSDLEKWKTGAVKPRSSDGTWLKMVTLYSDGDADVVYLNSHDAGIVLSKWTNGYLVRKNGQAQTVSELFTVTVGGVRYLLIENKNGDYTDKKQVKSYFIYTRVGD